MITFLFLAQQAWTILQFQPVFRHFAEDSAGLEKPPKIAYNVKNTVLVYYQYGVNLLNVLKQYKLQLQL